MAGVRTWWSMWAVDFRGFGVLLWRDAGVAGRGRVAGDEMTLAVYHHLRAVTSCGRGVDAEEVKIRAGSAEEPFVVCRGVSGTRRPRKHEVRVDEVIEVLPPGLGAIIRNVVGVLDGCPRRPPGMCCRGCGVVGRCRADHVFRTRRRALLRVPGPACAAR